MKSTFIKILFFLLLNCSLTFGQDYQKMIQGSWLTYNIESKSGDIKYKNVYMKYKFSQNILHIINDPTRESSYNLIPFEIKDKLIKTSRISESGYIIEKISRDSLIISDSYESKANRYYFVKDKLSCDFNSDDENISNSIFVANERCAPKQIRDIGQYLQSKISRKTNYSYFIKGKLIIYIKEKKIETIVEEHNLNNEKKAIKIINHLNETYNFWSLHNFQKIKAIEIPFLLSVHNSVGFEALGIKFL